MNETTQDVGIVPTRVVWDDERVRQMRSALNNVSLRLTLANPMRNTHMDEIERAQALKNLTKLISDGQTFPALMLIAHLLHELNARYDQLVQDLEDDE